MILLTNSPTQAGGTALYIDNSYNFLPRPDLKINLPHVENVWIEIVQPDGNIVVGVVYRHPRKLVPEIENFTNQFNDTLTKINSEHKLCYIAGDLNLNFLEYESNNSITSFVDMIYAQSFFPCITKPTHILPDKQPTLIDHVLTNALPRNIKSNICLYPIANGHLPITIVHSKTMNKVDKNTMIRNYKKFNDVEFSRHLEIDLKELNLDQSNDVNTLYNNFHSTLSSTFNRLAPLRKITKKERKIFHKPWLTADLLRSIKHKSKIYRSHYIIIIKIYCLTAIRPITMILQCAMQFLTSEVTRNQCPDSPEQSKYAVNSYSVH